MDRERRSSTCCYLKRCIDVGETAVFVGNLKAVGCGFAPNDQFSMRPSMAN